MPFARSRPSRGCLPTRSHRQAIAEHQICADAGQPFGRRYYWKVVYFDEIGDDLIDAMAEHAGRIASPHSAALHDSAAPARMDPSTNAVGLRTASYVLNIQAAWESAQGRPAAPGLAREYWTATRPFSTGSGYINFMTEDEGEARARPTLPTSMRDPRCQKQVRPAISSTGRRISAALEHDPGVCSGWKSDHAQ